MELQLGGYFDRLLALQKVHGSPDLLPIYGAGKVENPDVVFVFMNPTKRNIAAIPDWKSIRAPWLGTKNIWKLFYQLNLIDKNLFFEIQKKRPGDWDERFALDLYTRIAHKSIYITNLAKCTQIDARPLKNSVFKEYLEITYDEVLALNPQKIVTFGNQVSSIFLNKNITVSKYVGNEFEELVLNNKSFPVYPCYYPVGQGMRNINKAVDRIKLIME